MTISRPASNTSKNGMVQDLISKSLIEKEPKYIKVLFEHGKDILYPAIYNCVEWIYDYEKKYSSLPNRTAILDSEHSDLWTDKPCDDDLRYLFERYWGEQATRVVKGLTTRLSNDLNGTNIDLINEVYNKMRVILPPAEKPMIDAFVEDWSSMFDPTQNKALEIGLPIIDNYIFGLNPGEQLVLAGDTNVGKSWIVCYLAAFQLLKGKNVVLVTGEMNKESVIARISGFVSQISPTLLRNKSDLASLNKAKPLFLSAMKHMRDRGGHLLVLDGIYSSDEVLTKIEKYTELNKISVDLVLVDGQYLMKTNAGNSGRDWKVQAELAAEFYSLAFGNKMRLITTNQLGRGNSGSTDINTSDISGSYDYSRYANFMIGIVKPEQTTEMASNALPVLLFKTLKMRDGQVGMIDTISLDYDNVTYYKKADGKQVDMLEGMKLVNTGKIISPHLP